MKPLSRGMSLTYVADYGSGSGSSGGIDIYDRHTGAQQGQIGGVDQPQGLFVDKHHNLWVSSSSESGGQIAEFARGSTTPLKTLSDSGSSPVDVTVCPNGTVYASNIYPRPGNIAVYANGATSPTATLTAPNEWQNLRVTCDDNNNLFSLAVFFSNSSASIIEYASGQQAGYSVVPITLMPVSGYFPDSLKWDGAGLLLTNNVNGSNGIYEYSEAGIATGKQLVFPPSFAGGCIDLAVVKSEKIVGCITNDAESKTPLPTAVSFPKGKLKATYPGAFFAQGMAFDPSFSSE